MYGLLIKRYWKWITAICLVLDVWILAEPFMAVQQTEQVGQTEWNTYVADIRSQDENVSGVSIFGDSDSYNIRKIHKTAMIYEKLEDVVITPDKQDGAEKLLSDFYYYIFLLLFLGFEVIVLIADKDRGYDSLIQTFRYGNQPYRRKKLCFLCGTMFVVFWIVSLARLGISVGKYGFLGDVSVQSAPSFAHAWFLFSVYEMYVVQLLWRSIWIFIIGILAGVCCCFISRVWKGIFLDSIVVLGAVAF